MKRHCVRPTPVLACVALLGCVCISTSCDHASKSAGPPDAGQPDGAVGWPALDSGTYPDSAQFSDSAAEDSSQLGEADSNELPDAEDSGEVNEGAAQDGGDNNEAGPRLLLDRVSGRVIAPWNKGVAGRNVVIAGQKATTGANGSFSFDNVPSPYDVVITEPDGSLVSVYYGLTNRNPVLSHDAYEDVAWTAGLEWRQATVEGTLLGGFPFPVDSTHFATVGFTSEAASPRWPLGLSMWRPGPNYGPMTVRWDTSASVTGTFFALAGISVGTENWGSAFLTQMPLSLSDNEQLVKDLTLQPIAIGKISGEVKMYRGYRVNAVECSYRFPGIRAEIYLGEYDADGTFSCRVPDLTVLGGDYCISIGNVDPNGSVNATKCGATLGMTDFTMDIQAPPELRSPARGSIVTKDTNISWSGVKGGVYLVDFEPNSDNPDARTIQVYTSATSMRWPNLEAIGAPFLRGVDWTIRVSALLPYASMDEMVASYGIFALGVDSQKLNSEPMKVTTIK